ncbi:predicted protein [Streptomyces viridosporus ATCC 14672]|uniref:Predicted protein n=1 Tax=Streptomyces viridosporus (strain ATCC 14672 / DSM 40746 / JCM 4963 / KCTC 9882 / NRRL B-12104 / FH 1290) TaxID=566461 RepID=D6A944_STRV1|nr:predicted protein [Streptomyces viridosporus ATCC 14672]
MRASDVLSVVLPVTGGRPTAPVGVKVTPGAYNPYGGKRVQLAWLRYSTSQRRVAGPSVLPVRLSDPVGRVRPVACR